MNLAFVPVRGGSKGIPLKNIKLFCGRPLVFWCLDALQKSESIDEIFISTDCNQIKEVVSSFNFSKVSIYDRSDENAQDNSSTESAILEFLNEKNFEQTDLFFLVQATSPLTEPEDFDRALNLMKSNKSESLLTCTRSKSFFWSDNGEPINYDHYNRPRRQDFNGTLVENGAFYISSVGSVLKNKNRLSGQISIYEMDDFKSIELDEPDDWAAAENTMRTYILAMGSFKNIKLFLSDVDGTLTDASMYYSERGDELKKFNTRDGKGFELLRNLGIKTGIITTENTQIVATRAAMLKVDYLFQGVEHHGKLDVAKDICSKEGIELENV
ncbi:MAG: acylneuraminate cytidylyltransferase, partial [Bacteroidota bacterium]